MRELEAEAAVMIRMRHPNVVQARALLGGGPVWPHLFNAAAAFASQPLLPSAQLPLLPLLLTLPAAVYGALPAAPRTSHRVLRSRQPVRLPACRSDQPRGGGGADLGTQTGHGEGLRMQLAWCAPAMLCAAS